MLLLSRNELAFPSGTASGFNPSHVGAPNTRMSCVAQGGSFLNLINNKIGVVSAGAPAQAMHGIIGPVTKFAATTDAITLTGSGGINFASGSNNFTLACITTVSAASVNTNIFITGVSFRANLQIGSASNHFFVNVAGGSNIDSGIAAVVNQPVFFAASVNPGGTNFVVKNLLSGAVQTGTGATTAVGGTSDGNYVFGGSPSVNGTVAAAMASASSMGMAQLLAWADDPWSFWYPSNDQSDLFVGAQALAAARAATLAMMGVG